MFKVSFSSNHSRATVLKLPLSHLPPETQQLPNLCWKQNFTYCCVLRNTLSLSQPNRGSLRLFQIRNTVWERKQDGETNHSRNPQRTLPAPPPQASSPVWGNWHKCSEATGFQACETPPHPQRKACLKNKVSGFSISSPFLFV